MMKINVVQVGFLGWVLSLASPIAADADYVHRTDVAAFIDNMERTHNFERDVLVRQMAAVEVKEGIIKAMARPAERVMSWGDYRKIFIKPDRVKSGAKFWQENKDALVRAEQTLGVPAEVVVAIIGVETFYGRNKGSWRVADALSTLAFDYPKLDDKDYVARRQKFFERELEAFFLLSREQGIDPLTLEGSYAGAMGYGQFMPSSYRAYAIDFDGDDFIDIWNNPTDAIGSVANYFVEHGWQTGQPVAVPAALDANHDASVINLDRKQRQENDYSLADLADKGIMPRDASDALLPEYHAGAIQLDGAEGDEYWIGFDNFYVITRYNTSIKYAMAVFQLSEEIAAEYAKLNEVEVPDA